jgi:hypothetical protein
MTGLATFALANGLVAVTSVFAVSLVTLEDALEKALAAITIALSQIVASLLVAGVLLDRLEPITILLVNTAFLVAVVVARRLAANGARLALSTPGALASVWREVTRTRWLAVLLALAALQVVWRFVVAYVLPPSGFDALWYHLTTVAWWLQEGEITTKSLNVWSSVYPANGELFFTWVAVFLRDDTFLDVVQLAFGLVGVLAVAGIARVAGLGTIAAAGAGATFLLSPVVLAQVSSSYVDLIFVSTFLVAAYWVLRAFTVQRGPTTEERGRTPSLSRLVLAGLAGGVALGSKSTGVVYCGVLAAVVAAWLLAGIRRERLPPRLSVAAFSCFALPVLLLGGYWYARTWATYGNPFYPVRVVVAGIELFDGRPLTDFLSSPEYSSVWWKELLWQWHQDRVPFAGFRYFGVGSSEGGLGPVWSYLMLPALIPFVVVAAKRRHPILAAFFIPLAVIFALQPYRWWSRFTIYLLAAGAIALFSVIEWLPRRVAGFIRWAAVVLVVVGISYSTPTKSVVSRLGQPRDHRSIGDVVAPWFKWVDDVPAGSRIAVDVTVPWVGAPPDIWFFYPLFGSRFENEVFPLPTSMSARGREELAAQNIGYVVVGARGRYVDWARAEARAGCFSSVFADEHALVYRRVPRCPDPKVPSTM